MSKSQVFTEEEIASFRRGGEILRECLKTVAASVTHGIDTESLDHMAETFIRAHGALPAFKGYNGFPATLCISVNEECVHGIPGNRILKGGDLVSLDGGVLYDGLNTDACVTVPVGTASLEALRLVSVAKGALERAMAVVRPNVRVGDISAAVQAYVEGEGCKVLHALTGHGLGRTLHQFPNIPNAGTKGTGPKLPLHTVIAIEPIIALGTEEIRELDDGWTIVTKDGSLSAHVEHALLITENGCEILA